MMGTYIHPVVQKRVGDKWEDVPIEDSGPNWNPLTAKDHTAYAVFAGIGRDADRYEAIASGRGLPDDFFMEPIPTDPNNEAMFHPCPQHHSVNRPETPKGLEDWEAYLFKQEWLSEVWACDDCTMCGQFGHTWITFAELLAYDHKDLEPGYFDKEIAWLHTVGEPEDVRIVMGFDN